MLKLILKSCSTKNQTRWYFPVYFLNILLRFQTENQTCTKHAKPKKKNREYYNQMVLDNKEHVHAPVINSLFLRIENQMKNTSTFYVIKMLLSLLVTPRREEYAYKQNTEYLKLQTKLENRPSQYITRAVNKISRMTDWAVKRHSSCRENISVLASYFDLLFTTADRRFASMTDRKIYRLQLFYCTNSPNH